MDETSVEWAIDKWNINKSNNEWVITQLEIYLKLNDYCYLDFKYLLWFFSLLILPFWLFLFSWDTALIRV
jgi:hypothetical protein